MASTPGREPRPVVWRRERRIQIVNVIAVAVGVAYLLWRVLATATGADPLAFWALWAAEAYGVLVLALHALQGWHVPGPPPPRPPSATPAHVDVLVCADDEPDDVVEATLAGVAAIRYPDVDVHLCHDGRRRSLPALAASYGAMSHTRVHRPPGTDGAVNAALAQIQGGPGDLLLVLDADDVPDPRILEETTGYFDDPTVAVVQTPHEFVNLDSFQHGHDRTVHEQSLFHRVLLPGRDRHDAAFWCGSAAVLRRAALEEVGGVATETVTGAYHTTLKLIERGYVARVHDRTLVRGLAPDTLAAFLDQRHRWATGNLATLRTAQGPIRNRALRPVQRLHFLATGFAFLAGLQRLILWAVLVAALWGGIVPAAIDVRAFGFIWSMHIVLATIAGTLLGRGHVRHRDALRWQVLTAASYTGAVLRSLLPVRRRRVAVPSDRVAGTATVFRHAKLPLAVAAILSLGLFVRLLELLFVRSWLPVLPRVALGVVLVFGVVELTLLGLALVGVVRRRQRRASFRVETSLVAGVAGSSALVTDLSRHGLRLLAEGDAPAVGVRVPVLIRVPDVTGGSTWLRVTAHVRNVRMVGEDDRRWSAGCRLEELDVAARAAIALFVHVTGSREQPAVSAAGDVRAGGADALAPVNDPTMSTVGATDDDGREGPRPLARSTG